MRPFQETINNYLRGDPFAICFLGCPRLDNPAVLSLSDPVPACSTVVVSNSQTVRRIGLLGPAAAALDDGRARALPEVGSHAPKRQNWHR